LSIPEVVTPQGHRRWLVLAFSVALTVLSLYFVFRGMDRQILARLLATQDLRLLIAAAFFILLQVGLAGERWRAVLSALTRGRPPSILSVQAVFYSSIFFNSLPLGTLGGDVARVWLARRFDLSIKHLVLSVLVDRMLAVAALLILAFVTLPIITHPLAFGAWLTDTAILTAGTVGLLLLGTVERILGRWRHQRIIYPFLRAAEEMRHLKHSGGLFGLSYAIAAATSAAFGAYCIALSLNIGIGPVAMMAIISMIALIVALPISMAGWGVREVSVVTLLGLLGVDRASALLLSVEFGLLSMLLTLPGGAVWLWLRDYRGVAASNGM
jgi:glycosyltransferase 2 family protein